MMVLLAAAACILLIGVRWVNSRSQPQHDLGIINGRLADCSDDSNCVSTRAVGPEHQIDPLPLTQLADEAQLQLEAIIRSMPHSRIVSSRKGYVHAEFSSLLFGFVDDVELAIDEKEHVVHFRSASRTGRSDLGVNRKRMEKIRQKFQSR